MHRHGREHLQLSHPAGAPAHPPGRPASDAPALWTLWAVSMVAYAAATAWQWQAEDWKRGPFGLAQVARLGPPGLIAAALLLVAIVAARAPITRALHAAGQWVAVSRARRLVIGALLACGAMTLPTTNPGGDAGQILREWRSFHTGDCFAPSHDEVLETVLHQAFYCRTHEALGWSLERSFVVSDAIACALAVTLLIGLLLRIAPRAPALALVVAPGAGWAQLYLGDIEVYTLTSAVLIGFLDLASRHLAGEVGLWAPTLALAVSMIFHLQSGFLLPVLVSLWLRQAVRGRPGRAVWSALGFVGVLVAALAVLHVNHLPVQSLWASHALGAGRPYRESLNPLTVRYLTDLGSLLLLLFPGAPLLALLAWRGRLTRDADGLLLLGATACFAFYFWAWRADFGPMDDWDLFANAFIPSSVLLARTVAQTRWTQDERTPLVALLGLYAVHTLAWWVANAQPLS